MFDWIKPLSRIAVALEEIARALSYFAMADARTNRRFYLTRPSGVQLRDESELLHTNDQDIRQRQHDEFAKFLEQGYPALEADDEVDQ